MGVSTPFPTTAAIARAELFTRERFVYEGESLEEALAAGSARRRAIDAALAEIEQGAAHPSIEWRRQFSLLLGLERLLSEDEPHLADGTRSVGPPGRRAVGNADRAAGRGPAQRQWQRQRQRDSGDTGPAADRRRAGYRGPGDADERTTTTTTTTRTTTSTTSRARRRRRGRGRRRRRRDDELDDEPVDEVDEDDDDDSDLSDRHRCRPRRPGQRRTRSRSTGRTGSELDEDVEIGEVSDDPNADRRFWFEHATGAGKTVAALGFVEASRTGGVLILTHRRNLVDQFHGELRDRGYRDRIHAALLEGPGRGQRPGDGRDLPVVRAQRRPDLRRLHDRDLR